MESRRLAATRRVDQRFFHQQPNGLPDCLPITDTRFGWRGPLQYSSYKPLLWPGGRRSSASQALGLCPHLALPDLPQAAYSLNYPPTSHDKYTQILGQSPAARAHECICQFSIEWNALWRISF